MLKIQKMDFLIALYVACIAITELMGGKTFFIGTIGGYKLNASVAIFVIPIIFTINDVITEVFGAERAKSVVRSGLLMILLLFLYSVLAVALPPSTRFMTNEKAYDTIFGLTARIAAASLISFAVADFLDIAIFAKIRKKLGTSKLWLRNNASNFLAQLVDTTLFMFLAFYAFNLPFEANLSFLVSIILPYWLLKCFMSVIETPLVYLGVRWLKSEA